MRRKSLTDQRNDTVAGGMAPLTNSDVFNLPIKYMASGFNLLHAGIFSMLFCHLLILPDLGSNCFTKVIVYKECGQAPLSTSSPGSPKSLSWY